MELHSLRPVKGAVKTSKRIGRGQGSGKGGTSTKGHKGAQSRSGHKVKSGFEGGQMPLYRRVPKFGFKNPFKVTFKVINLDMLQELSDKYSVKDLSIDFFINHGVADSNDKIKVLSRGELKSGITVTAHAFSKNAASLIEAKGGKTVIA